MRKIGDARNLTVAKRFFHYLRQKKIESSLKPSDCLDGLWQVWVFDEDKVDKALFYWEKFENSLGQFDFEEGPQSGDITFDLKRDIKSGQDLGFERTWAGNCHSNRAGIAAISITVICCVLFALLNTSLGNNLIDPKRVTDLLGFEPLGSMVARSGIGHRHLSNLALIQNAVVGFLLSVRKVGFWRFLTPSLLHSNFCQLCANSVWLWIFAGEIERRAGAKKMLLLWAISSSICNATDYLIAGECRGGMEGVICAVAIFCAMKRIHFPWEDYRISTNTLLFYSFYLLAIFSVALSWNHLLPWSRQWSPFPISITGSICGLIIGYSLGRFSILRSN